MKQIGGCCLDLQFASLGESRMGETGLVKRSIPERDNRPKGLEVFYDHPSHTCGGTIKGKPCYNRICSSEA